MINLSPERTIYLMKKMSEYWDLSMLGHDNPELSYPKGDRDSENYLSYAGFTTQFNQLI